MITPYERLVKNILDYGEKRTDRTGTGTLSLFAPDPIRYSLSASKVPLITSKRVFWKMATAEFMWMLSGSTQIDDIESPQMRAVWENWANEDGDIGPTYGAQYRNAGAVGETFKTVMMEDGYNSLILQPNAGVDQLAKVIDILSETPDSRRAIVSLWSVPELPNMGLEPCMTLFQFSLRGNNLSELDVHVYQRSADMILGVPFDLYQAGLLTHLIARELRHRNKRSIYPRTLTWSAGDTHVYLNQMTSAETLVHQAIGSEAMRAKIVLPPDNSLRLLDNNVKPRNIEVVDYHPAESIQAPLAV